MTLLLLVVAAAVLARVCRRGMRHTLAVAQDARDLQRRWGVLSCQETLLPRVEGLLPRGAPGSGPATSSREADLAFGGQRFHLVFADEQAKVNLNVLYHIRGKATAEQFARTASRAGGLQSRLRLRPRPRSGIHPGSGKLGPPVFGSFGQVFAEASRAVDPSAILNSTKELTCWGDGRLNYRQATAAEITAIAGNEPDVLKSVLARQKSPPGVALSLNPLNLTNQKGRSLDDLFTDTSACFSMWVIADDGAAKRARFCVREMRADGRTYVNCFSW